jgi:iron complex outermembrane recepter protein
MKLVKYSFYLVQFSLILEFAAIKPLAAEELNRRNFRSWQNLSTSAIDLLAQQGVTRVTGVELNQTDNGLEVILKTAAGGERLVPLILPEGNNLVIDILGATLGFSIRNGVTETNPSPGIKEVNLVKINNSSIRLTIIGEKQTPSAEVVPSQQNLILSVTPEQTTARQTEPEEEIEILVTSTTVGTRTETDPLDVPQSIQTIPREVIENRQVNNFTEALRTVPGIVPNNETGLFSEVNIRGFVADYRRNGLRSSGFLSFSGEQTANIERIEVLKGPASVLYGQGSFGGTVNLVTKKPTNKSFYQIDVAIGNYDLYRGAVDLSGPLNESKTVKYRLNLAAESAGSFIDFNDRERYLVAPVLTWQIGKNTDLTFEAEYSNVDPGRNAGLPARGTIFNNPNGDIPRNRFIGVPERERQNLEAFLVGYNLEHRFSKNWRIRNAFQFSGRILGTPSFLTFESNLQEDDRTLERTYDETTQFDSYSYLLDTYTVGNFKTGSIKHELLTGIELSRDDTFFASSVGELNPLDLFEPDYDNLVLEPTDNFQDKTVIKQLGIYLQDKIEFSDSFILLLGGRFDIVSTDFEDLALDTDDFQQDEAFSPRVGLVYKPISQLSLYASYSSSFFPNTFARSVDDEFFDPQEGTQYEIGVKAEIDQKLSATLAYFDTTITNVLTEDISSPGFSVQTGEQNSKGVELSVAGEILPGWNVIGGYVYNDAKVTEDNVIEVGNRLNNVPEHAISLATNYEIQEGDYKGLGVGLEIYFVGDRQGDIDNTFEVPGYTRTDASIFYNRGKFRTALNFRNLFDIDYFESTQSDLRVRYGDPFTVIGSVSFEF